MFPQIFSPVKSSVLLVSIEKASSSDSRILIILNLVENAVVLLEKFDNNPTNPYVLTDEDWSFILEFVLTLKTAISQNQSAVADSEIVLYISLTLAALKEVSIGEDEISEVN